MTEKAAVAEKPAKLPLEVKQTLASVVRNLGGPAGQLSFKLFRVSPLPPTFNGRMSHVHSWKHDASVVDVEEHLRNLGLENGWESGLFELQVWLPGQDAPTKTMELAYEWPSKAGTPGSSAMGPLRETVGLAKDLLTIGRDASGSPGAGAESLATVFVKGLEAAKGQTPDVTSIITLATTLATALRPPPAPEKPVPSIVELAEQMRALGWAPPGGSAAPAPADPLRGAIENVITRVVTESVPRLLGEPAGPPSLWPTIAREALPVLGRLVDVLGRAAEAYAVAKAHAPRPAVVLSPGPGSAGRPPVSELHGQPPAAAIPQAPSLLAPFREAITTGNFSVFPQLRTLILTVQGGAQILGMIQAGMVTWATLPPEVKANLPELELPGAALFFERFTAWLQQPGNSGAAPQAEAEAVAACAACGESYDSLEDVGLPCEMPVCTNCPHRGDAHPHHQACGAPGCPCPDGRALRYCGGTIQRIEAPA